MPKTLNVGMIGYKFMGRAHSNAWLKADKFFDLKARPVMKVICGRDKGRVWRQRPARASVGRNS
jgi:predicted dehydrogenase